jgi:hypothetical protein
LIRPAEQSEIILTLYPRSSLECLTTVEIEVDPAEDFIEQNQAYVVLFRTQKSILFPGGTILPWPPSRAVRPKSKVSTLRTRFRWLTIATILVLIVINYIDRSTIAYAIQSLSSEFGINASQYGLISSAFSIGYMILPCFRDRWSTDTGRGRSCSPA